MSSVERSRRSLSSKLLDDLRDGRDRLNQTPQNSSHPSGSYAPWEQAAKADQDGQSDDFAEKPTPKPEATEEEARAADKQQQAATAKQQVTTSASAAKQPGAKGVGREVKLAVTSEVIHKATGCACCGENFAETAPFQASTARYLLEIERTERGLEVSHVKHI